METGWVMIAVKQLVCRLLDNLPTNQLTASQVTDWSTRGLVNSPTVNFLNH